MRRQAAGNAPAARLLQGNTKFLVTGAVSVMSSILGVANPVAVASSLYRPARGASAGKVKVVAELTEEIKGKDVLLVEDIVDSGLTAQHLLKTLAKKKPRSINICALLAKHERRVVNVHVEYVGFTVPNQYIVGYGLDYRQKYRNLPYLAVLDQNDLQDE